MPRHPPCALHSLSHTPPTQPTTRNTAHRPHKKRDPTTPPHRDTAKPHQSQQTTTDDESDMAVHTTHYKDARVHYPDLKQQPHTRTNAPPSDETSSSRVRQAPRTRTEAPDTPTALTLRAGSRLILQNPNSVSPTPGLPRRSPHPSTHPHRMSTQPTRKRQEEETRMSMIPLVSHHHALAPRHHSTVAEARAQVGVCAP